MKASLTASIPSPTTESLNLRTPAVGIFLPPAVVVSKVEAIGNAAPCAARELPDKTRALAAFNEPRTPSVLATFRIMACTVVYQLRARRDNDNHFKVNLVHGLMIVT